MFWICAGNSIDNVEMFLLYGPIVEQCLRRAKAFSASRTALPVGWLRVHKELGGDTDRTGDPN